METNIDLKLPSLFRNVSNARRFAIDIGGSLAKLAYSSRQPPTRASAKSQTSAAEHDAHLHFVKFEAAHAEHYLSFIRDKLHESGANVHPIITATGGGAYKYKGLIEKTLGLVVHKEDEIKCLIRGCNLLLQNITDEAFTYHHHEQIKYDFDRHAFVYPYILVNIGSGVSVIKVDGENKYERIGGTSFGGGSFWGLGSLLTGAKGFEELLALAEKGDHRSVDMLVADIYGGMDGYESLKLSGDIIASSFGKAVRSQHKHDYDASAFAPADMARSLLLTVSNTIGQMAVLYALNCGVSRIYFGGFFIRGNPVTMRTITFAVNYFSKGNISALFLRHEGYLGAIGAFALGAEHCETSSTVTRQTSISWREHYAGSIPSSFARQFIQADDDMPTRVPASSIAKSPTQLCSPEVDVFELEIARTNLTNCCLIDNEYVADTVDLTQDEQARQYWIECLRKGLAATVKRAAESEEQAHDAHERARRFGTCYEHHLDLLLLQPFAYGRLNVRSLLDLNVQLLNEFGFIDVFKSQKEQENEHALTHLSDLLTSIDALPCDREKCTAIVKGLLAGNVFDWGASHVASMMADGTISTFAHAKECLPERPWLCDDLDAWCNRLQSAPPYKCAAVFVDNSGFDIICGVLPFVRDLLQRDTKVILCANANAVLNDITHQELIALMERVRELVPEFDEALKSNKLTIVDSGQTSPCLDLRRIDQSLNEMLREVDLVVVEGMGRAIHTNYEARFKCDSLKTAVIKNEWLARRLGGELFAAVFRFEQSSG